ncbi:tripartite tricarboxylate transporter substrate-binding protein [Pseudomonas matsuisoli]|uniref:Exported protein n=1 Tax=Pseudomonas matsuisoli TaxID=1515666 RepID=A0A917UR06_9PSED|nr:tripartite tricarboxylate transporter substrate-binding protein [Pseudomonas matsuisoli]GGJ78126.1 exported protein [Pseudomonas matsuisoli]
MLDRRTLLHAGAAATLLAGVPGTLRAQSMPSTGRLIFGLAAGSVGSRFASAVLRMMADDYDMRYDLQIIDTGEGLDAARVVKVSPADGATLLQAQAGSMTVFPSIYERLPYDPLNDFVPIAILGEYAYALVLGPAVPVSINTVDGYLKWVTDNPDFRDLGFSIYGSEGHLAALSFARAKEVALRPQSYRTPLSMFGDLRSGALAACVAICGNVPTLGVEGVRAVAVSGARRQAVWPEVPTFKEAGVGDIVINGWYGWFGPSGISNSLARSLNGNIRKLQATSKYADLQGRLLLDNVMLDPAQITERMRSEIGLYKGMVQSFGLSRISG